MIKHHLIKNMRKLNFHLVPVAGAVKKNGGKFRAEFVRGLEEGDNRGVVGVDDVIAETLERCHYGIPPDLLKLYVKSVLQTMIDKTVEDGRTRRFDDYLSVGLGIHGGFNDRTDDFDFDRHSLGLTIRPLNAFRPSLDSIYPVNVNRLKQFRLSYVTAADGRHTNHQIVYGEDFIIRGSGLNMPELWGVTCHVNRGPNEYDSVAIEVKERADGQLLCAWPEEVGEDQMRRSVEFSVWKLNEKFHQDGGEFDSRRCIRASIYPS